MGESFRGKFRGRYAIQAGIRSVPRLRARFKNKSKRRGVSHQYVLHDLAMHIGQSVVATLEAERQFGVVHTHLVEDGRLQIVDVDFALYHVVTDLVGLTVNVAWFKTATGEPHGVSVDVVVAARRFTHLAHR